MEKYRFEDIPEGFTYSIRRVLTREMIDSFIKITGDKHPLHFDKEYSKIKGYKDIMAHGMLTSALASTLVGLYLPGLHALIVSQSFKYLKPVYPGESLIIEGTVQSKIEAIAAININVVIKNDAGEIFSKGEILVKFRD